MNSKCPGCGGNYFEMKYAEPTNAAHPVQLVQCSKCGVVVGVMPNLDTAALLLEQNRALVSIAKVLNTNVSLPTQ